MAKIVLGQLEDGRRLEFLEETLRELHNVIVGTTGQRKTVFLVSVLSQYVRFPNVSVVNIDLGGDQAAFWTLKEAADDAKKPFYFLSLGPHDSCSWDYLRNTPAFAEDLTAATMGTSQGMRLEYGEGYGRSFWSRLSGADINKAFDQLTAKGIVLPSFNDLCEELRLIAARSGRRQQVSEAYLAAEQLRRYAVLTERRERELWLGKAIEEGAVVYFYLPTAHHGAAARAIASLAAWCTTVEASYRVEKGLPERRIVLAIDEFPQIAAGRSAVSSTLTLARKWNIVMYLVLQDMEQARTADGDLKDILRSQCQQIIFTAESEEEQNYLRLRSQDVLRTLDSQSFRKLSATTSVREYWEPGLTRNEIMELNGVAMKAFGVFKLGDKHRDPIPFTILPAISKTDHTELKNKPLPPLVNVSPTATIGGNSVSQLPTDSADRRKRADALTALLQAIQQEETWKMGR
ncbi:MAG: TraM recognition domain-containing protein [Planctomycetales bacterium]|nr:TraM recognition domain-containing protein [Planctomycetales bacterium]